MKNELTYGDWQKLRSEMRRKEEEERSYDLGSSRPPIQVSISDQIVRHIIKEVRDLQDEMREIRRILDEELTEPDSSGE